MYVVNSGFSVKKGVELKFNKKMATVHKTPRLRKSDAEKELICTVCLGYFKEPKVLPCLHTFCKTCLEGILEKSREKRKQEASQEKEKLACPQCQAQHDVPQGGPAEFLTDFSFAQEAAVVMKRMKRKRAKEAPKCDECDSTDPAIAYCCDCQSHLCNECSDYHKKSKRFRSHKVVSLEEASSEALRPKRVQHYCDSHPDKLLDVYCKTCYKLLCSHCIVAAHKPHDLASISDTAVKEELQKLKALADKAETRLSQFRESSSWIDEVEKATIDNSDETKAAINTTFDSLVAILESRRKQLLEEVASESDKQLKQLWGERDLVDTTLTSLDNTLRFTQRALRCEGNIESLSLATQAIVRLKELEAVEWRRDAVEEVEDASFEFEKGNHEDYLQKVGNVYICTTADLEISTQDLPGTLQLGVSKEFQAQVHYKQTTQPLKAKLEVKITYGNRSVKTLAVSLKRNPNGSWSCQFTPVCGGWHTIELSSAEYSKTVNVNVTGIPAVGARVCRGPDWLPSSGVRVRDQDVHVGQKSMAWNVMEVVKRDGGPGQKGTVTQHQSSGKSATRVASYQGSSLLLARVKPGYETILRVQWDWGHDYDYTWSARCHEVQLALDKL